MGCGGSKPASVPPGEESVAANYPRGSVKTDRRNRNNVFEHAPELDGGGPTPRGKAKPEQVEALIRSAIKDQALFAQLTPTEIQIFVDFAKKKSVKKDETVIEEGDPGDNFYIVQSGTFNFTRRGHPIIVKTPKSSFGELALLFNAPRAATVTANEDGVLWYIDRKTFRHAIASSVAQVRKRLVAKLSKVGVLQSLGRDQLEHLADIVSPRFFSKGDVVLTEGEQGDSLYIVEEGKVQLKCSTDASKDMVKGVGDVIGESALVNESHIYETSVTAKQDVVVLELSRKNIDKSLGPLRHILAMEDHKQKLKKLEFFAKLSPEEKAGAIRRFIPVTFRKGQQIIRQGDPGDSFFVIDKGTVNVLKDGQQITTLGGGAYFGEMALISHDDRRTASVIAETDVDAYKLSSRDFASIVTGNVSDILSKTAEERHKDVEKSIKRDIPFKNLKRIAALGAGTFGRVTLVQDTQSQEVYALKALHKKEIVQHKQQENVMNEKNIMMKCHHEFILKLYNTYKDQYRLYMLLEYCPGGELFTVLHTATRDGVDMNAARFYAAGVGMALEYLTDRKIMYRDLKPENMLVDLQGYPKLIDFGFAKEKKAGKTYTLCGTPEYMAPEIILGRGYNHAVDWWAYGILVYECLAGYSPFCDPAGANQQVICQNIVNGHLRFPRHGFDHNARELLRALLSPEPSKRPGMGRLGGREVFQSGFFQNYDLNQYTARRIKAPWLPKTKSKLDTSHFDPYHVDETVDESFRDNSGWDKDF